MLRAAQATDALRHIKAQLCTYQGLVRYKIRHVARPRLAANARARILLVRVKKSIRRDAERYRAARAALVLLDLNGDWRVNLRPLLDEDLKGPSGFSPEESVGRMGRMAGEGYRVLSWIWKVQAGSMAHGSSSVDGEMDGDVNKCEFRECWRHSFSLSQVGADLKVEYAKSKTRVDRWEEEILLVAEEMCRTVDYLRWKAKWWLTMAEQQCVEGDLKIGLRAYAHRQAGQFEALADRFCLRWKNILTVNSLDTSWIC